MTPPQRQTNQPDEAENGEAEGVTTEQLSENPLIAGFGTATADEPPYPAQQQLDAWDGDVTAGKSNAFGGVVTHASEDEPDHLDRVSKVDHPQGRAASKRTAAKKAAASHRQGQDSDQVPDGTVDEVTEWVGDDPDRAQRALDAENAKSDPRTTLTDHLERIVGE